MGFIQLKKIERKGVVMKEFNEPEIPPIDRRLPAMLSTATFALGWFWGSDARFGSLQGVYRTRVGYSGGNKVNPTYHDLGDHSEAVQIDFNPAEISYSDLLNIFWNEHDPELSHFSRQYMSIIFFHNAEQQQEAMISRNTIQQQKPLKIRTEINPLSVFYLAEDYHQKYYLQSTPELMKEFRSFYPLNQDFINSTAAARVNGYLGGYGMLISLRAELANLGLTESGGNLLLETIRHKNRVAI
jgi:peptide-methionine (S)-S-oxide reductase